MLLGIRFRQVLGILRSGDDMQAISVVLEREPLGDMRPGNGRGIPSGTQTHVTGRKRCRIENFVEAQVPAGKMLAR